MISEKKSMLAVHWGLAANIILAALKTSTGILGHSPALLADGINSTSDAVYYVVISVFMRFAHKPADAEHPYGHTQLDTIAALVVGSFVITTAIAIFWDALNNVYDLAIGKSTFHGAASVALWIALFTVVIKAGLTIWTKRIGKRSRSATVQALAYDHRNDIFSAAAASTGIYLGRLGYPWVDPLAGAIVSLMILYTGIQIIRESTSNLMDTVAGKELAERIYLLLGEIPGVKQIEEVHAHRFGIYLVINITIGLEGSLTVAAGDEIASHAERKLLNEIELLRRVHVHYHPAKEGTISKSWTSRRAEALKTAGIGQSGSRLK
jgi:cation diffusion facilitator family transporter